MLAPLGGGHRRPTAVLKRELGDPNAHALVLSTMCETILTVAQNMINLGHIIPLISAHLAASVLQTIVIWSAHDPSHAPQTCVDGKMNVCGDKSGQIIGTRQKWSEHRFVVRIAQ